MGIFRQKTTMFHGRGSAAAAGDPPSGRLPAANGHLPGGGGATAAGDSPSGRLLTANVHLPGGEVCGRQAAGNTVCALRCIGGRV